MSSYLQGVLPFLLDHLSTRLVKGRVNFRLGYLLHCSAIHPALQKEKGKETKARSTQAGLPPYIRLREATKGTQYAGRASSLYQTERSHTLQIPRTLPRSEEKFLMLVVNTDTSQNVPALPVAGHRGDSGGRV